MVKCSNHQSGYGSSAIASMTLLFMILATASAARVAVVGGGASGYFAAISAARSGGAGVVLLEGTRKPLKKVLASGGGRCNVMHDPALPVPDFVERYPRGSRELRGPYTKVFGPEDAKAWFEAEGVTLKTEADGRVFPVTDDARTVADALTRAADAAGVDVRAGDAVTAIDALGDGGFAVSAGGETLACDAVVLATGSSPSGYKLAAALGHEPVRPYPSLFSFRVPRSPLDGLAGLSLADAALDLAAAGKKKHRKSPQRGPLLVTHRGVSGPAALKLSAFLARELKDAGYRGELRLDALPSSSPGAVRDAVLSYRRTNPKKAARTRGPFSEIPRRLWARYCDHAAFPDDANWADVSEKKAEALAAALKALPLAFDGKDTNKDEFVTAGGVCLKEVDMRTFESKKVPGLHVTGELLDVDGVTGGFNFMNCWCSGYAAGASAAARAGGA